MPSFRTELSEVIIPELANIAMEYIEKPIFRIDPRTTMATFKHYKYLMGIPIINSRHYLPFWSAIFEDAFAMHRRRNSNGFIPINSDYLNWDEERYEKEHELKTLCCRDIKFKKSKILDRLLNPSRILESLE